MEGPPRVLGARTRGKGWGEVEAENHARTTEENAKGQKAPKAGVLGENAESCHTRREPTTDCNEDD